MNFPLPTLKTFNAIAQMNHHWTSFTGGEFMEFYIPKEWHPIGPELHIFKH